MAFSSYLWSFLSQSSKAISFPPAKCLRASYFQDDGDQPGWNCWLEKNDWIVLFCVKLESVQGEISNECFNLSYNWSLLIILLSLKRFCSRSHKIWGEQSSRHFKPRKYLSENLNTITSNIQIRVSYSNIWIL